MYFVCIVAEALHVHLLQQQTLLVTLVGGAEGPAPPRSEGEKRHSNTANVLDS